MEMYAEQTTIATLKFAQMRCVDLILQKRTTVRGMKIAQLESIAPEMIRFVMTLNLNHDLANLTHNAGGLLVVFRILTAWFQHANIGVLYKMVSK